MNLIQVTTEVERNGRFYIRKKNKTEHDVYSFLKESYGASTRNVNYFELAIKSVDWDKTFEADGETYYCANGFMLTIENINPFEEAWRPSIIFSDGSMISL